MEYVCFSAGFLIAEFGSAANSSRQSSKHNEEELCEIVQLLSKYLVRNYLPNTTILHDTQMG